jgi:hypothetical protein
MKARTSPAITALTGGYEIAFQADDGHLWTNGTAGNHDWGPGMMAGTSPAITAAATLLTPSGFGYEMAFQAGDGHLWTNGLAGNKDWGVTMMAGTSPAITELRNGLQLAVQTNSGYMRTFGVGGSYTAGVAMSPGTSPAITTLADGTYQIAFQANNAGLFTIGPNYGLDDTGLRMMTGTSPSIAGIEW